MKPASQVIMEAVISADGGNRVTLGSFLEALGGKAFALAFLALALPCSLPIPAPPGLTTIFGIPLMILSYQMISGRHYPTLPKWASEKSFDRQSLILFLSKAMPAVQYIEKMIRPRWECMFSKYVYWAFPFYMLFIAFVLAVPIPFGNILAGLSISFMAIGFLEKDGVSFALGIFLGILSTVVTFALAYAGVHVVIAGLKSIF